MANYEANMHADNERNVLKMVGLRFGRLTVLREIGFVEIGVKQKTRRRLFECKCDCGKTTTATQLALKAGTKKSCGCLRRDARYSSFEEKSKRMIGERFHYLTVLGILPPDDRGRRKWLCKCDCGNQVSVASRSSKDLMAKSCGCKKSELVAREKTKHGLCSRSLGADAAYLTYSAMVSRARRKSLDCDYFGKPKEFCEWFYSRIEELNNKCPILGIELERGDKKWNDGSPTIDRVDISRGYVIGNIEIISHRANQLKSDATLGEVKAIVLYMEKRITNDQ